MAVGVAVHLENARKAACSAELRNLHTTQQLQVVVNSHRIRPGNFPPESRPCPESTSVCEEDTNES
jgi:hypothetical protein